MANEFMTDIENMNKPEIQNKFFLLRGFGYQAQNISTADCMSIIWIVLTLCCMMRNTNKDIEFILGSM